MTKRFRNYRFDDLRNFCNLLAAMRLKHLLPLVFAVAVGCESASQQPILVTGTVKFADGKPVTGESTTVVFQPISNGRPASATIKPDGSFEAMTEKPGDGMHPGEYKVVLNVFKNYREQTFGVPERYADVATTPLTATVDADTKHFDFVVER
jgi:hypothetical protein